MASLVMVVGSAIVNGLAFSGSNYLFSKMNSDNERQRHDLAVEKLAKASEDYEKHRLAQIDFVNERMRERGHANHTFLETEAALKEYNLVTEPPPKLSDYYQPTKRQKMSEIVFIVVGMTIVYFVARKFKTKK